MSTRHAPEGAPLSQERYLSSPEYTELHGVSAMAVAPRVAIIHSPEKRALIWYFQALSLQPGGLKRVARELVELFPERIRKTKLGRWDTRTPKPLENFLVDLCINPRLLTEGREADAVAVAEEFPEVDANFCELADAPQFEGILEALAEYKRRNEQAARDDFVLTANGRTIWDTLDFALQTGNLCLINGREGRGKTEAAKAYLRCHLGEVRFASLKAITSKTSAFREIARALGVACGPSRTATEMQARIEDVLQKSRLLLILDEAHWCFNQSRRIYSRPELIDWISTLSNHGVPICLISTPQFMDCMERAAAQVQWNWRQFRRRVKRYRKLLPSTSAEDVERVARKLFPDASAQVLNAACKYATVSRRDLSGLGDLAQEAELLAKADGRTKVKIEDLKRAISEYLLPSDSLFAEAEKRIAEAIKRPSRKEGRPGVGESVENEDGGAAAPRQNTTTKNESTGMKTENEKFDREDPACDCNRGGFGNHAAEWAEY